MKKLLSLTLSILLLLNLFVVGMLPIHADPTDTLDDHLVVHYDFKGETVAEALKDKATAANNVADDLSVYTKTDSAATTGTLREIGSDAFNAAFAVDTEKGTATNLVSNANMLAATSTDIQKLYGTATWFFRFKVEDVSAAATTIMDMKYNNSGRCMTSFLVSADGRLNTYAARTASKRNTYYYSTATEGIVTDGVYINFAVTMQKGDGSSGYTDDVIYTPYFSVETPQSESDWIALTATGMVAFRPDGLTLNPLSLFDRHDCAGSNNTGVTLDDVRLYDKIMTKAEIAAMFADGLAANAFDAEAPAQESVIEMDAYQTRDVLGENAFDARFVASLDKAAIENAENITFEVSATYAGSSVPMRKLATTYVYEKIWNGTELMAHPDGDYYAMFTISGIDDDTTVTFTVTPVINYTNGTSARGETKTVTFPTQA